MDDEENPFDNFDIAVPNPYKSQIQNLSGLTPTFKGRESAQMFSSFGSPKNGIRGGGSDEVNLPSYQVRVSNNESEPSQQLQQQ